MLFEKYRKIHRLGAEENDDILNGTCYIQEKIDGANTQIWLKDDGSIGIGSRNRELGDDSFNGFKEYVEIHNGIKELVRCHPEFRLYGEWLVKHTINYKETSYKKFYLFDIEKNGEFIPTNEVNEIAEKYNIEIPHLFGVLDNPSIDLLKECVGDSVLGEVGEGIVIKNFDFVNKFGDLVYAKIVTEKFKEENAITFGGNNKHSDSYWEMYIVNKYISLGRVQKVINKLQPEINERLDMKHIPRITNTVYHDMLTECIWEIQKKVPVVDFKKLPRLCMKKSKQIYIDILNDSLNNKTICDHQPTTKHSPN